MVVGSLLLALHLTGTAQPLDTARRVADTLVIEPLGIRLTIPSLWMGRIPAGATMGSPPQGRIGCQLGISGPPEDRIVVEPARFMLIQQGIFGERRSYQDALDAVVGGAPMVAHVGGDRFNSNCIAPQAHIYVLDTAAAHATGFGAVAQGIIERSYTGVRRVERDSAGWHVERIAWREAKTDFSHPATLDIWSRTIGSRVLIIGIMDSWAANGDTDRMLASVR